MKHYFSIPELKSGFGFNPDFHTITATLGGYSGLGHDNTFHIKTSPSARTKIDLYARAFRVTLVDTPILYVFSEGTKIINTGGWNTHTTKQRLNLFSCNISQKNWLWYVNGNKFSTRAIVTASGVVFTDLDKLPWNLIVEKLYADSDSHFWSLEQWQENVLHILNREESIA